MAFNRNNSNFNNNYNRNNLGNAAIVVIPGGIPNNNTYGALNFVPKVQESYEAFLAVDTDRSGAIDWRELQTALQKSFGTPARPFPGTQRRRVCKKRFIF